MSPMYNPYAVSNGTPTDPLEVFKLPPNVIQAIQQAAKGLTVNINQPKPGTSGGAGAPKLPGQAPAPRPMPAPNPAPAPSPQPAPSPGPGEPPGSSSSTVHYPGIPGNPGDPSNDTGNQPPTDPNDPTGSASSTVNYPGVPGNPNDPSNSTESGFWSQDPYGNPLWVDNPGSSNAGDPFSGGDNYGMGFDPAAGFNGPGDPNSPLSQLGNAMYGGDYSEGGGGGGGGSNLNEQSAADYNYFDE